MTLLWLVLLILAVLLWLLAGPKRVVRDRHPDHDNAQFGGTDILIADEERGDPRDVPTAIYGEEIDTENRKYILLVAGEMVQDWVVVLKGWDANNWPDLEVVRASEADPAWTVLEQIPKNQAMAATWQQLVTAYTAPAFTNAGWTLVQLRAFGPAGINAALDVMKSLDPAALAVHYVGHGDFDFSFGWFSTASDTDPYLAIRGVGGHTFSLRDPTGQQKRFGIAAPDSNQVEKYYIRDLAPRLVQDFPDIPLTLVIDACGIAQALDHKQGNLNMVVSVDRLYCGANLAMFSGIYASAVTPGCYDNFPATMPGVVAAVNNTLRANTVSYVWAPAFRFPRVVRQNPPQEASSTTWKYPWD